MSAVVNGSIYFKLFFSTLSIIYLFAKSMEKARLYFTAHWYDCVFKFNFDLKFKYYSKNFNKGKRGFTGNKYNGITPSDEVYLSVLMRHS